MPELQHVELRKYARSYPDAPVWTKQYPAEKLPADIQEYSGMRAFMKNHCLKIPGFFFTIVYCIE